MGLVSLADVKAYIGESGNTYDIFLQQQIDLVSDSIEAYCQRKFLKSTYVQTFYSRDFDVPPKNLQLFHYPLVTLNTYKEDSVAITTGFRKHLPSAILISDCYFLNGVDEVEVNYDAGYLEADIPSPIRNVVFAIVEEKYNKKKSGVALNFGSDVQRISIAGVMSIDYDYSLNNNERGSGFGTVLGSHINVLDAYRSERRLVGSSKLAFVGP